MFTFQFPIDLEQFDRREQLKKSGLGKVSLSIGRYKIFFLFIGKNIFVNNTLSPVQVIMFLSKSDEEITANRKIAKDLVDKWVILFPFYYFHISPPWHITLTSCTEREADFCCISWSDKLEFLYILSI